MPELQVRYGRIVNAKVDDVERVSDHEIRWHNLKSPVYQMALDTFGLRNRQDSGWDRESHNIRGQALEQKSEALWSSTSREL